MEFSLNSGAHQYRSHPFSFPNWWPDWTHHSKLRNIPKPWPRGPCKRRPRWTRWQPRCHTPCCHSPQWWRPSLWKSVCDKGRFWISLPSPATWKICEKQHFSYKLESGHPNWQLLKICWWTRHLLPMIYVYIYINKNKNNKKNIIIVIVIIIHNNNNFIFALKRNHSPSFSTLSPRLRGYHCTTPPRRTSWWWDRPKWKLWCHLWQPTAWCSWPPELPWHQWRSRAFLGWSPGWSHTSRTTGQRFPAWAVETGWNWICSGAKAISPLWRSCSAIVVGVWC